MPRFFSVQSVGVWAVWELGCTERIRKDENILVNDGVIYLLYINSSKVLFFNGINQQYQG